MSDEKIFRPSASVPEGLKVALLNASEQFGKIHYSFASKKDRDIHREQCIIIRDHINSLTTAPQPAALVPEGWKADVLSAPALKPRRTASDDPDVLTEYEESDRDWFENNAELVEILLSNAENIRRTITAAPQPVGDKPLSVNRFGVDADYFTKNLNILIRDMANYTPSELARSLGRLAVTADSETMREAEFNIGPLYDNPKYLDE